MLERAEPARNEGEAASDGNRLRLRSYEPSCAVPAATIRTFLYPWAVWTERAPAESTGLRSGAPPRFTAGHGN